MDANISGYTVHCSPELVVLSDEFFCVCSSHCMPVIFYVVDSECLTPVHVFLKKICVAHVFGIIIMYEPGSTRGGYRYT